MGSEHDRTRHIGSNTVSVGVLRPLAVTLPRGELGAAYQGPGTLAVHRVPWAFQAEVLVAPLVADTVALVDPTHPLTDIAIWPLPGTPAPALA